MEASVRRVLWSRRRAGRVERGEEFYFLDSVELAQLLRTEIATLEFVMCSSPACPVGLPRSRPITDVKSDKTCEVDSVVRRRGGALFE